MTSTNHFHCGSICPEDAVDCRAQVSNRARRGTNEWRTEVAAQPVKLALAPDLSTQTFFRARRNP